MFGFDLSASVKLAVICIIKPRIVLQSDPNLGLDLSYFSFLLYFLFHLEFDILFHSVSF